MCVGSGARSLVVRCHMFVQREQDGLDCQMVEGVVSSTTMCQFLCMMAVSCLPMSEKGVIMERMLVSVCGGRWDNR